MIAKTEAFRFDGKLFNTEKEALEYQRVKNYQEAIAKLRTEPFDNMTEAFIVSLLNEPVKRNRLSKLIGDIEKIDEAHFKLLNNKKDGK